MKKTILSTALMSLLCHAALADNAVPQPATPATAPAVTSTTTIAPATTTEAIKTTDIPTTTTQAPVIDCKYAIPPQKSDIEPSVISTWAEKAAMQSFSFNPATVDQEMNDLKLCYTDQGWQGFSDALQKSGNIDAIKTQHLTVSSQMDGEIKMSPVKDNQWKVTVPLQVVYQNEKEKLTQLLTVDLLVGRKVTGDLGIMQMIASPRTQQGEATPTTSTPENNLTPAAPVTPTPQEMTPAKSE